MTTYKQTGEGIVNLDTNQIIKPWDLEWLDYEAWLREGNTPDNTELKSDICQRINEIRAVKLSSLFTVTFNGYEFDADPVSIKNVQDTLTVISLGFTLPSDFTWRSSDNQDIPLTVSDLQSLLAVMAGNAFARSFSLYKHSWLLKEQVMAASDPLSVDIT